MGLKGLPDALLARQGLHLCSGGTEPLWAIGFWFEFFDFVPGDDDLGFGDAVAIERAEGADELEVEGLIIQSFLGFEAEFVTVFFLALVLFDALKQCVELLCGDHRRDVLFEIAADLKSTDQVIALDADSKAVCGRLNDALFAFALGVFERNVRACEGIGLKACFDGFEFSFQLGDELFDFVTTFDIGGFLFGCHDGR